MAEASYDLLARADADSDLYLAARIRYSPEEGCISVVQGWSMGSYSEVEAAMQALPEEDTVPSGLNSGEFYALVRQYLSARLGADQIFFSGWDQLPPPQEGDLLLTRVDYLGSARPGRTTLWARSIPWRPCSSVPAAGLLRRRPSPSSSAEAPGTESFCPWRGRPSPILPPCLWTRSPASPSGICTIRR